ncbi:response regulator [Roseomonas sp. GC11]|uniref:response regulator n=1 Tax=Roseomonas sp. GC11 TaxID=2950546 RepID=UPI00210A5629|nr:response regulator [Roseomonas sp. GC11]MCQ4162147.1 response regulator [Roseomonas sp. GC11]
MKAFSNTATEAQQKLRILYLEDNEIDQELVCAYLARSGYDCMVLRCETREDFIRNLQDPLPDIILADYTLPHFDGLEALSLATRSAPAVPFIFVTGTFTEEAAVQAMRGGAVDYVVKQRLHRLPATLQAALADRDAARRLMGTLDARLRLDITARIDVLSEEADGMALPLDYEGFLRMVLPEDRGVVHAALEKALNTGMPWVVHCRLRNHRGLLQGGYLRGDAPRQRNPGSHPAALHAGGGQAGSQDDGMQVSAVWRPLSEKWSVHAHLQAAMPQLSRTAFSTHWAQLLMDPCGHVLEANEAGRVLLAASPAAARQENAPLVLRVHTDDLLLWRGALAEAARIGRLYGQECRALNAEGRWRRIVWDLTAQGNYLHAVGRDVTEDRAAMARLAAAHAELVDEIHEREAMAERARRSQQLGMVGQLTAGVAHDFNNLLMVVLGQLDLLRATVLLPEQAARLEQISQASLRGQRLTTQLLAFARRQTLAPRCVALNDMLRTLLPLLQVSLGARVELRLELEPGLPAAFVDPTQVEMVVVNLAINARDAMERGGRLLLGTALEWRAEPPLRPEHPEPGEYVTITVQDDGCGMDARTVAQACEPFFTTKATGKGSGLGLSQVLGFVRQSGGGLEIESWPGQGTRIRIFLPPAQAGLVQHPAAVSGAPALRREAPRQRILLVDDDPAVRSTVADMLDAMGHAVEEAEDAEAALSLLRRHGAYDLLLTDHAMPGMSGTELAAQAAGQWPGMGILLMTGYAENITLKKFPILPKPFQKEDLQELLGRVGHPLQ